MELKFDPANPNYIYITTQEEAEKALEELEKEKVIAVDIEANELDPYTAVLLLVQVGTEETSYIFDARKLDLKNYPRFKNLLENPTKIKLLQNAKFDYGFIKTQLGIRMNNMFDTMLAEGVLTAGIGSGLGLKDLAEKYIGHGLLDKSLQSSFKDMTPNQRVTKEQLKYAGADTLALFPIFEQQLKKLQKENLLKIAKLEFAVCPVVSDMELAGVYIDTKKWRDIIKNLEIKRDEKTKEFQEAVRPYYNVSQFDLFGGMADSININSNSQLLGLFNTKLGLELPSTGIGILSRVNHPLVKILTAYRGYEKLISTYGEAMLARINKKTGRIHPDFLQIRTATGRFACNNPNLQNIPRNSADAPFRECFNPREGYKLVVSDYSSFEMRILAELSGDEKMIHAINEGLDIHSYTASLMFDKPYSENFKKEYPSLRQMAKPIGFGLMYGMGAQGLVGRIFAETGNEIPLGESENLIERYFKSYPGVKFFLDKMAKDAQRLGWSSTPAGRKRWYRIPEKSDPEYKRRMSSIGREAKNHPIQGTNADAIKYALVFVKERMEKEGVDGDIVSTVHDEIVCEIRNDQAEDFAKVLSGEMIKAGELFLKKVKVMSDPFVGDVWEH